MKEKEKGITREEMGYCVTQKKERGKEEEGKGGREGITEKDSRGVNQGKRRFTITRQVD